MRRHARFQSSPGTLTGCDEGKGYVAACLARVSILTRHADRVRPHDISGCLATYKFQSSPGTLTGCDSLHTHDSTSIPKHMLYLLPFSLFQSSPGTLTGCDV